MSDPRYGDRCVKTVQKRKRVIGMCFAARGNETPESEPAETAITQRVVSGSRKETREIKQRNRYSSNRECMEDIYLHRSFKKNHYVI